jgi:hypothetical protein
MSKKSKSTSRDQRKKAKAGRKVAERAKYEAWRDQGINKKSKRHQLRNKRKQLIRFKRHTFGACGNVGCISCSPTAQLAMERRQLNTAVA